MTGSDVAEINEIVVSYLLWEHIYAKLLSVISAVFDNFGLLVKISYNTVVTLYEKKLYKHMFELD